MGVEVREALFSRAENGCFGCVGCLRGETSDQAEPVVAISFAHGYLWTCTFVDGAAGPWDVRNLLGEAIWRG